MATGVHGGQGNTGRLVCVAHLTAPDRDGCMFGHTPACRVCVRVWAAGPPQCFLTVPPEDLKGQRRTLSGQSGGFVEAEGVGFLSR